MSDTDRLRAAADRLDGSAEETDAEHLSRAEARLDTISPVIVIDPAMGVNITEQIKTLFQVVAKSPRHGAAIVPCDCLVCSAVHSLADTILSTPVPTPPAPSLRDEVVSELGDTLIETSGHDRLRAAADRLDDGGIHGQREWPEDDLCICGLDWDVQHRRDVALAALLRALADERNSGMVVGDWDSGWKVVMKPLWVAALALADTILGVGNE